MDYRNLTEEEIRIRWEHLDKLSELTAEKLEQHVKYIQNVIANRRQKLRELIENSNG